MRARPLEPGSLNPAGDMTSRRQGSPPIPSAATTVRGERKLENADKQEGYHRVERSYGSFARRFTLPSTVEMGNVTAQSHDGVLRIFLPKKAETKPRQIKVQTDSSLGGQGMGRTVPVA